MTKVVVKMDEETEEKKNKFVSTLLQSLWPYEEKNLSFWNSVSEKKLTTIHFIMPCEC